MEQYTRGTKTEKVMSANLKPRDRVLTFATPQGDGSIVFAGRKTGSIIREVADKVAVGPRAFGRQRRYVILFTDGTQSVTVAPIQTWHTIV